MIDGGLLAVRKALVVGIANDSSIAYGCAAQFREAGAELAITWLNVCSSILFNGIA